MKLVKRIVRTLFPSFVYRMKIVFDFIYDLRRFLKYSAQFNSKKKFSYEARLIMEYHKIEKALTLPNVRKGFGKTVVLNLIKESILYYKKYGYNSLLRVVVDSLNKYKELHLNFEDPEVLKLIEGINQVTKEVAQYDEKKNKIGGVTLKYKNKIDSVVSTFSFEEFASCRYSIRDFTEKKVSNELILKAINISLLAPSACNRQAWKVRQFKEEKKNEILKLQNGNRGFTESIDTVLFITGYVSAFFSYERSQVFIDGGIYSMVLMYALHSLGLGTCALNTSFTKNEDKAIRKKIKLEKDEVPILMLAVGHLKDNFYIANSHRKKINEVLVQ